MPQLFSSIGGVAARVFIHKEEHAPAHCHIRYAGEDMVVYLITLEFHRQPNIDDDMREKILSFVEENQDFLIAAWQRITGLPL